MEERIRVEKRIVEEAEKRAGNLILEDVCIGVGYTGVRLSDGYGGVSYTFRDYLGPSCGVIRRPGTLKGTTAKEAVAWMLRENLAEASVGAATVNALLNRGFLPGANIATEVSCGEDDVIGMVGWFCPLVWKYQSAGAFYIFEQKPETCSPSGKARILEADQAEKYLPECTKVVLTGTSFINKTAGSLLAACRNAEEIIIVGASTPMCPSVLREYGVTMLAGTQITDADRMFRIVAEGGGGMDLSLASEKLLERL